MRIRRGFVQATDNFTIVPNAWVRDPNLSRRARGLLTELLSHREGWDVSIESLWRDGTEGREAVRGAVKELENAGYLHREQARGQGARFGASEYVLRDPHDETAGHSDARKPGDGKPGDGKPGPGNARAKKNNQEDQPQEEQPRKDNAPAPAPATRDATDRFDEFWATYPRRQGKGAAVKAWAKAIKRADPDTILKAAAAYRDDPQREPQYTAHPSTWLNQDRWEDEPLPGPSWQGPSGRGYDPSDWLGQDTRPTIEGEVVGQMEIGR